jgi:hypothetical protein
MATAKQQLLANMNPQMARLLDNQMRDQQVAQRSQGAGMLAGLTQAYTGMGDLASRALGAAPMGANEMQAVQAQQQQQAEKAKEEAALLKDKQEAQQVNAIVGADLGKKSEIQSLDKKISILGQIGAANPKAIAAMEKLQEQRSKIMDREVKARTTVNLDDKVIIVDGKGNTIKEYAKTGKGKEIKNIKAYKDINGTIVEGGFQGDQFMVVDDNNKLVPAASGVKYTPVDLSRQGEMSPQQELAYNFKFGKLEQASEAIMDAEKSIEVYGNAIDLLNEGINTGKFVNLKNETVKLASSLGFDVTDELEAVSRTEAYGKNMGNAVASIIKAFGSGTGLSDKDREYAEGIAAGDIKLTEDALRRLIDMQSQYMRLGIEKYNRRIDAMGDEFASERKELPRERIAYFKRPSINIYEDKETKANVYHDTATGKFYNADGYLVRQTAKK